MDSLSRLGGVRRVPVQNDDEEDSSGKTSPRHSPRLRNATALQLAVAFGTRFLSGTIATLQTVQFLPVLILGLFVGYVSRGLIPPLQPTTLQLDTPAWASEPSFGVVAARDPTNPLWAWWNTRVRVDRGIRKWEQYIDLYHRHFQHFRGKPITMMEVGLSSGGSLDMWRHYFGPQARLIGCDILAKTRRFADGNRTRIFVGSQADPKFWDSVKSAMGDERIDIFLDDGGHTATQVGVTFANMYDMVKPRGLYWVEDVHSQYWGKKGSMNYGGGLQSPASFVERAKTLIDSIHAFWSMDPEWKPDAFTRTIGGIHFYDSIILIEKAPHTKPKEISAGGPPHWNDNVSNALYAEAVAP